MPEFCQLNQRIISMSKYYGDVTSSELSRSAFDWFLNGFGFAGNLKKSVQKTRKTKENKNKGTKTKTKTNKQTKDLYFFTDLLYGWNNGCIFFISQNRIGLGLKQNDINEKDL